MGAKVVGPAVRGTKIMSAREPSYSGQCLCGAIRYNVVGALVDPHTCHCQMCRRQSGHFVAGVGARKSDFTMTGEENVTWYQSSSFARRGFCRLCGSNLFWDGGDDSIGLNIGSLDQPTGLKLERHIYVEAKADYYEIDDSLPKFVGPDSPSASK